MKNLQEWQVLQIFTKRIVNFCIAIVIVCGYGYLLLTPFPSSDKSICLFKSITGISCPGCGMGRSTWLLLHGELKQSLFYHPLGMIFNLFMLIALIWAVKDFLLNKDNLLQWLKQPRSVYVLAILAFVIIGVWIRNIHLGM